MKRKALLPIVIITWMSVILACGSSNDAEATVQAINEIFSNTATAAAPDMEGTDNAYLAAQAKATEQALALNISGGVGESAMDSESLQATAAAEAPVFGELKLYGIETENGHVEWVHAPTTLEVEGYMAFDYASDYPETIIQDFVIASDITWNTQYGSSGCGYLLRSNGDQNSGDQYMVLIKRGGNGHLLFGIIEKGKPVGGYDIFPRSYDKSFDWHNDGTNRVTVVGRGGTFTFYTNGTWVGEIDLTEPPPKPVMPSRPSVPADQTDNTLMESYRIQLAEYENLVSGMDENYDGALGRYQGENPIFEKGFFSMISASESGASTCQFDDTWLWMIDP